MVAALSAFAGLLLLLLALKLTQRLTVRLKVLAGVTVSRNPQKSCPHLGHAADPFNHGSTPSDEHRCYLYMQRDRIDLLHQKSFCLSTAHHRCPWLMIRRPDAPPSLRERLRRLKTGGLSPVWEGLGRTLKGAPALAMSALRVLGRAGGLPLAGVRTAGRGLNAAVSILARAIRNVTGDSVRGMDAVVGRLAAALRAIAGDTQRAGTVVPMLAGLIRSVLVASWWLVRLPVWGLIRAGRAAHGWRLRRSEARRIAAEAAALRATAAAQAMPAASQRAAPATAVPEAVFQDVPVLNRQALAALFPGLDLSDLDESAPAIASVPSADARPAQQDVAEPLLAGGATAAAAQAPADLITQRLEAPLARFEELLQRLESLVADGVSALDKGQETLAYQLFLKATEQAAKVPDRATPELRDQHTSLMTRAWFWRAKTAETVEEVVDTLAQALQYEPGNLQIQAHLAWARQRLERDRYIQQGAGAASIQPVGVEQLAKRKSGRAVWWYLGAAVRIAGGLMALALAALWMTTGVLPALGSYLQQLPAGDELLLRRFLLTINATALPGNGHLPLPMLNYDLGLSLPFVLAFLFVFTARGLMDGDNWARTTGLVLAGVGGWLCAAAVSNPDASRLGLGLCVGIIVAAVIGRFDGPQVPSRVRASY